MSTDPIRVKMFTKAGYDFWSRQLPDSNPLYRGCRFLFDEGEDGYDWLVVYDDLPPRETERRSMRKERLLCPVSNTVLITVEPANIKNYGRAFTRQFGHVLTSQPEGTLPHPGRIYSQPALYWFYGADIRRSYNEMEAAPPLDKTGGLSTVCSNKQQKHTVHNQRYLFTQALKEYLPDLEVFGRGIRPIHDKCESLDPFRYHIAIENYIGPHHWTEKLADAFLGCTLPFYYGCPNVTDYFPAESLIPIDIHDVKGTADRIRRAMADHEYEKRLPYILEARRRVLEEYNIFAVLAGIVTDRHAETVPHSGQPYLRSRRLLRKRPSVLAADMYDKLRLRLTAPN